MTVLSAPLLLVLVISGPVSALTITLNEGFASQV